MRAISGRAIISFASAASTIVVFTSDPLVVASIASFEPKKASRSEAPCSSETRRMMRSPSATRRPEGSRNEAAATSRSPAFTISGIMGSLLFGRGGFRGELLGRGRLAGELQEEARDRFAQVLEVEERAEERGGERLHDHRAHPGIDVRELRMRFCREGERDQRLGGDQRD